MPDTALPAAKKIRRASPKKAKTAGALTAEKARALAEKALCSSFGTGYCWSLPNPHYTGHHRTREEAVGAAIVKSRGA